MGQLPSQEGPLGAAEGAELLMEQEAAMMSETMHTHAQARDRPRMVCSAS